MNLSYFITSIFSSGTYLVTILLIVGVILVNGWTDAPNAIATVISTRSLPPKAAISLAVLSNFLGVFLMTLINSNVANTLFKIANFDNDGTRSIAALCAAMFAIVLFAVVAWYFGIPTSESHALIAGITGAAIALNGAKGINTDQWLKVIIGLFLSIFVGFTFGFLIKRMINSLFKKTDRQKSQNFFRIAQIIGGGANAFMHGAQDGQKFMGILFLGTVLYNSTLSKTPVLDNNQFQVSLWMVIFVSVIMSLGTSIGGYRIIKSVGMDMVKLDPSSGFCADASSSVCLLLASIFGIPVSTTHTKTSAMLGVGSANNPRHINWSIAKRMVFAWIFTFPTCAALGFVLSKVFIKLF